MEQYQAEQDAALLLLERVNEAQAMATMQVEILEPAAASLARFCYIRDEFLMLMPPCDADEGGRQRQGQQEEGIEEFWEGSKRQLGVCRRGQEEEKVLMMNAHALLLSPLSALR